VTAFGIRCLRAISTFSSSVYGDPDDLHASIRGGGILSVFAVVMNITLGQIVVDLEIGRKGVVLLGVEHLKQSRGRIAAEIGAHLVNSSSRNSGFEDLALRIDWMILPGIEPI